MNVKSDGLCEDEDGCRYTVMKHSGYSYADASEVVLLSEEFRDHERILCVDFYDLQYSPTGRITIKFDWSMPPLTDSYVYLKERDIIVIGRYIIDLRAQDIQLCNSLPKAYTSIISAPTASGDTRLIMIDSSSIFLYDLDMQLTSSCRLKGKINSYYTDDAGHAFFITADNDVFMDTYGFNDLKASDRIRLYKIDVK